MKSASVDSSSRTLTAGKGQPSKPDLSLPPGRSSFPFTYRLPAGKLFPWSFEGKHGYVRYRATATLSIIRLTRNKETNVGIYRPFAVVGPKVDLNSVARVKVCPLVVNFGNFFLCWWLF